MTEAEFEKKGLFTTKYGYMVQTAPLQGDVTMESEFRFIKEAILNWSNHRGRKCAFLRIQVIAPAPMHNQVKFFLQRVYNDEVQLAPILQRLKVDIVLLNEKAKPVEELQFS